MVNEVHKSGQIFYGARKTEKTLNQLAHVFSSVLHHQFVFSVFICSRFKIDHSNISPTVLTPSNINVSRSQLDKMVNMANTPAKTQHVGM